MMCQIAVPRSQIFPQAISLVQSSTCSSPRLQNLAPEPPRLVVTAAVDNGGKSTLKRKRPGRIEIPDTQMMMSGGDSETPGAVEELVKENENGLFAVYCKKGRRVVLEDRYSAVLGLHGDPKQALFGVFDGHGGVKAAEFAANNLEKNIMAALSGSNEEGIEHAVRNGYLDTDQEFLKQNANGGTCCVTALIRNGDLVISNAGDCRAVLSRGGVAEAITSDHRPSREDERDRIESQGGYVDCRNGVWRIHGTLAVSRAIGDRHLKQFVTAEPETKKLRLEPECEFLVLASDGLWDQVSNQEAADIVRPLCVGVEKPEPFTACKKLVNLSVKRGSNDDISVLIVQLRNFIP